MFQEFTSWYKKQALFTRTYIAIASVIGLIARFKPAIIQWIIFDSTLIVTRFQIWRLFTHYFILGVLNFNFVWNIFWCIFAVKNCESMFEGQIYPDFYYMVSYLMLVGNICAFIFDYVYLAPAFQFALIYIWCKRRPFETVRFYFSIQVKSQYFPWILMGFHLLMDQDVTQDLIGLAIGQSYLLFKDYLPVTNNIRILETPKFFTKFIVRFVQPYAPFQVQDWRGPQQPQQEQPRFFQGAGHRLG